MQFIALLRTLYRMRRLTALFVVLETVFKVQKKRNARKSTRSRDRE